jgi:hypothetical protein
MYQITFRTDFLPFVCKSILKLFTQIFSGQNWFIKSAPGVSAHRRRRKLEAGHQNRPGELF